MIITYHRESFIKVQQGDLVVAFNPISREADSKATRFGADLCLTSLNEPLFNGCEAVSFGNKEPFIINSPGEYEVDGIFVYGLISEGAAGRINTIFATEIDGIRLCHLGGLANPDLDPKTIEDIGGVDILFVPISGTSDQTGVLATLSPKSAAKLAASLEPKLVIPVMFENGGGEVLSTFAKEMGGEVGSQIDKLTLKRKDLEGKEGELVIIKAS